MIDRIKILMALSAFAIVASLYQIITKDGGQNGTFLVIYCALIVIFNRDKALSKDKIARVVVIATLLLLVLKSIFLR
jgi:hypothetical protein